jgi:hypothetical protein
LRGVSFEWKNVDTKTHGPVSSDIGFIAQEIQQIFPELVFKKNHKDSHYMVKYSEVIALCLEAIKEQSLLLDEKEERLEKLEMKVK